MAKGYHKAAGPKLRSRHSEKPQQSSKTHQNHIFSNSRPPMVPPNQPKIPWFPSLGSRGSPKIRPATQEDHRWQNVSRPPGIGRCPPSLAKNSHSTGSYFGTSKQQEAAGTLDIWKKKHPSSILKLSGRVDMKSRKIKMIKSKYLDIFVLYKLYTDTHTHIYIYIYTYIYIYIYICVYINKQIYTYTKIYIYIYVYKYIYWMEHLSLWTGIILYCFKRPHLVPLAVARPPQRPRRAVPCEAGAGAGPGRTERPDQSKHLDPTGQGPIGFTTNRSACTHMHTHIMYIYKYIHIDIYITVYNLRSHIIAAVFVLQYDITYNVRLCVNIRFWPTC